MLSNNVDQQFNAHQDNNHIEIKFIVVLACHKTIRPIKAYNYIEFFLILYKPMWIGEKCYMPSHINPFPEIYMHHMHRGSPNRNDAMIYCVYVL